MVTVLVFPGQGAQRVGMGKDLAEAFPIVRETLAEVDEALSLPLSALMREGPEETLQQTENTQPAILAHSAAVLALIGEVLGPVAAAGGHSLGEYTAYHAAGTLSLTDAVRLVRTRGELMQGAGRARPGAMSAILGLESEAVEDLCVRASRPGAVVVPANLNAPDQTVISGDPAGVESASTLAREAGAKRVISLKVSGAFHSPLMAPAVDGLAEALNGVDLLPPRFPVVANATAEPVRTPEDAVLTLTQQLTAPVRWVEVVRKLADIGGADLRFLEVGPGNVLAGLVKRTLGGATVRSLGTLQSVEEFLNDPS